jgi:predicted ATPase/class 3 adenylate cyclase
VTFLFTDLEGSTRLWEQHPDAMHGALARHDEILRSSVDAHDGVVVKTTGDGFHAVFASAQDAVAAATTAQRSLGAEPWGATGPLLARIGVHTCEAELRDGDYYGSSVNRAARLMSAAHGGQIVVSAATERLVHGVALRDLGEHRLRDLDRAEHVYQLVGDGLLTDFPPLRGGDAPVSNLPSQLTSFVGRTREMQELRDLVLGHRLVTVTGVGGVGKTRLALQLGADVASEIPDGVWLCELAAVEEPDALIDVVATTLGVSAQQGVTLLDSVLAFLRSKRLLLVLDNCEHLLRGVDSFLTDALAAAPNLTVLATSREGIGAPGEQLMPLRTLDVGGDARSSPGEHQAEAVVLFADRARAVTPDFVVDDGNRAAIGEICRRLDGLPLAIELAAARVGAFAPAEIEELLDERFRLLTGSAHRAVDRHQTLRSAIDWSYSLLDTRERTVFDRLAVFVGGFDAAAARAVVAGDGVDAFDVVDALGELVAKSMVTVDRTEHDRTRYVLLETLRAYALESLDAQHNADSWRRRHAEFFADYAVVLGRGLVSATEIPTRHRAAFDLDNFRTAMGWALGRDDPDDQLLAVRTIAGLGPLVSNARAYGLYTWAERAVPAARAAPDGLRFAALGCAAFAATVRGDLVTARVLTDEAFMLDHTGDCPYRAAAYTTRAITMYGDLPAAMAFLADAAGELEAVGDAYAAVTTLSVAGMFAALAGDRVHTREYGERALVTARALGNPTALSIALLGWALPRREDDPQTARAALEEALAWVDAGASDVVYTDLLEQLARVELVLGDGEQALRTIARSLRRSTSTAHRPAVLGSLFYFVEALGLLARDPEVAAVVHGFATEGPDAALVPGVSGHEAELHERALDAIRSDLGETRFDELARRGASMTYDAAVEFTMSELARITAEA